VADRQDAIPQHIGIVKKNAIMTIDFALAAERLEGKNLTGFDL
jgi:multidrug efflux pump subunit AcrB